MSGIQCSEDCLSNYHKLSKGKSFRFVIYRLADDKKTIVFDTSGERTASFEDFRNVVMEKRDDPCYAAFDFNYRTVDGQERNKIGMLMICSDDDVGVGKKMLLTSSKGELTNRLDPATFKEVQINDFEDLNEEEIINTISNNKQK